MLHKFLLIVKGLNIIPEIVLVFWTSKFRLNLKKFNGQIHRQREILRLDRGPKIETAIEAENISRVWQQWPK